MQKYVVMDGDGYPIAFYSVPDIHKEAPPGAVPISQELWQEWIIRLTRTKLVDGQLVSDEIVEPTQAEIDEEQTRLIERQGTIIRALAVALFNVGNDVRVLKGQKPVTPDQFRNYIKGLLR